MKIQFNKPHNLNVIINLTEALKLEHLQSGKIIIWFLAEFVSVVTDMEMNSL